MILPIIIVENIILKGSIYTSKFRVVQICVLLSFITMAYVHCSYTIPHVIEWISNFWSYPNNIITIIYTMLIEGIGFLFAYIYIVLFGKPDDIIILIKKKIPIKNNIPS